MRRYIYVLLFASLWGANSIYGQFDTRPWTSVTDFTSEQQKYKKDIEDFLGRRHGHDSANFCYDISNYMITVDPFGGVYDSAKFTTAKFIGEEVPLTSLSSDSIYFRSQKIVPGSETIAVYNEGRTLIYSYVKHNLVYGYGNALEGDERKLEVYVKHNGKWIWVANGGTNVSPPPGANKK